VFNEVRMEQINARPVTILTGFLGAGKTTFLNALMANNPQKRYAIIENEIGDINVDGQLVTKEYGHLIELQNGCLCCTLNDDLYEVLAELNQRASTFDELIIECTGLALPATVIEAFTMHPTFKKYFPLLRTICMVDAELIEDQLQERDEVLRQLTLADVILINKTRYVHGDYLLTLEKHLTQINPLATVCKEQGRGIFPLELIDTISYAKATYFFLPADANYIQKRSQAIVTPTINRIHSDIEVKTYTFQEEFSFMHLYLCLSKLVGKYANQIYRMKGITYKTGNSKKVVVQSVGTRVNMDYAGVWKEQEARQNTFVVIGKDIEALQIDRLLRELLMLKLDKAC